MNERFKMTVLQIKYCLYCSICSDTACFAEYIQKHWDEDEFFGYQFLNGLNPMMVQRCSNLPENFPVTEDMVKNSLRGSSLQQEMKVRYLLLAIIWSGLLWFCLISWVSSLFGVIHPHTQKGNIFLSDYKMLDGLVGNVVSGRQQYLTAPLVLLYCNPHSMMLPIAIQVRILHPKCRNPGVMNITSAL